MTASDELKELLAGRGFRRLVGTRLLAQGSDGVLQAALATFVLFSPEREPDPIKVAASFAILLLPYSLIGPFAGVFLDRWRRRDVLVYANLLKALLVTPVIVLVVAGNDGVPLGIAVLVVLGIGRFVLAGLSASMPHVVSGRQLVIANAIAPTAGTIMSAAGALGGVVVARIVGGGDTGSVTVILLAALGYATAGLVAAGFKRRELGPSGHLETDSVRDVLAGLVDGFRSLVTHATAGRAVLVVGAHRVAFGVLTVGGLLLVRNTFNTVADADTALAEFAVITGAAAVGAGIGAVVTPFFTRRIGAVSWSVIALAQAGTVGIGSIIIGATMPSMPFVLAGALSLGFAGQSVKVCSDTLVQRHVPDDHLGRVFSLFDMFVNVCLIVGVTTMAFTAPVSGQAPLQYLLTGALLLTAAAWYARAGRAKG